jgi:hypothetical protein
MIYEKGSGTTITPPQGWTLIRITNNSNQVGIATFYKVAGKSEPTTYSFPISNSPKWNIGISRVEDADTSNPIDAHNGSFGGKSITATAPSLSTSTCNTLVLTFFGNKTNATWTPGFGLKEVYDVPNSSQGLTSNMMAYYVQAKAGNTGDKIATSSKSEVWVAQQIAIRGESDKSESYTRNSLIAANSEDNLNKEQQSEVSLIAFPNPVIDRVSIQFPELTKEPTLSSINIFDQVGRMHPVNALWHEENSSLEIDFSSMSKGLYIIRVSTQKGAQTLKVIKE